MNYLNMDKLFVFTIVVAAAGVVNSNKVETAFSPDSVPSMPESCKSEGLDYCMSNENYPTEIVKKLVLNLKNLEIAENGEGLLKYGQRDGIPEDDDCPMISKKDQSVYYIIDENGEERVVVQLEGKFQQKFTVRTCVNEGRLLTRTSHFSQKVLESKELKCEHIYANYEFLVLSSMPDINGNWKMERVRMGKGIPVYCACVYNKKE